MHSLSHAIHLSCLRAFHALCANLNTEQHQTFLLTSFEIQFEMFILRADQTIHYLSCRKPSIHLTLLVYIQCSRCLSGWTCSAPSRVCTGRPLHPPGPLPQHYLQLQLVAAVGPAGLHLRPLPHSGLVPVSDL